MDNQENEEPTDKSVQEPAPETAAASPQKPANELKVVIVMKDGRTMLGVQSPDCDPVYTTMDGTLATALKKVPALVAEAKEQWAANPRYPKADLPKPAASPPPARTPTTPKSTQPKAQPSFF